MSHLQFHKNRIVYVLYHLDQVIDLSYIKEKIVLKNRNEECAESTDSIIFNISNNIPEESATKTVRNIPVLFSKSESQEFYSVTDKQLIFHDGLLQSAFYLLSGQQEYNSTEKDKLGRFPYDASIQKKLNIIDKPIVNYYFEIIAEGIEKYCAKNNLAFRRKKPFENFAFFFTHDIDLVDYYDFQSTGYLIKELLGLSNRRYNKATTLKLLHKHMVELTKVKGKGNPYWNFEFLVESVKTRGLRSTYFFLPKDQLHVDSYYDFNDDRIRKLISWLEEEGCEVGLHGTVRSATDEQAMKNILKELNAVTGSPVQGIRQHRLTWSHPETAIIQEKAGLSYDTTLGFAAHEGFRNSYCLPFRLYDFEKERMTDNWEIPLVAMDETLFGYRKLGIDAAKERIESLIKEIKQFNGIFTMLWHNSFFDENLYPGITNFYLDILDHIKSLQPESLTGTEIIDRFKHSDETN